VLNEQFRWCRISWPDFIDLMTLYRFQVSRCENLESHSTRVSDLYICDDAVF